MNIEYLSSWILQIVVFIILAMIVDMILPSSTLKQYVKLVIGLLLMLVILQPLLSVFNVDAHKLVNQFITTGSDPSMEAKIENQLNQQKSEIEQIQDAYVLEEMVVQMKNMVEKELAEAYNYQITEMDVNWTESETLEDSEIDQVHVQLTHVEDAFVEVEEVNIQVGDPLPHTSESEMEQEEEVKQLLADKWEVEKDTIHIRWKEE
ncbi:stage III sporulation protein AF [Gracilibacillus sp. S3-1-1]|uniref:Stage III sporulation protein AF n=1 Tax=Gracilibacillus pellucidus TaxID=3095368 RepID=A0ACC6M598_9BACI|nr:stage III sporulation protein AF [Gracilibacillus sp. S3-1-1]MDX8046022.1 stage III sporulation protein AF [Gracilibacillus sp. S3-1-1]